MAKRGAMRKCVTVVLGILLMGVAAIPFLGQGQTCDRACLEGFIDQYLDALVAHNPKMLPLVRNVKFTENGQKLEPGDGLWNSIAGKGTYRLFVDDTQTGQEAFIGTIRE